MSKFYKLTTAQFNKVKEREDISYAKKGTQYLVTSIRKLNIGTELSDEEMEVLIMEWGEAQLRAGGLDL